LVSALAAVMCATAFSAVAAATDGGVGSTSQARFRFCTGVSDGCTHPGRGYAVCENFLKMLNALPPDEPPPVCEIKLPPGFAGFALPEWEDMPVVENMRLIYDMEMHRLNTPDRVPPEWKQYYPDEHWKTWDRFEEAKAWRRVPYDIWLAHYRARMEKGEIEPRLRRTRVALNQNGPETLLAYEWVLGGDAEYCRMGLGKYNYAIGRSHIYLMTTDAERPIREISDASKPGRLLLTSQGKALFLLAEHSSYDWFLSIAVAHPLPPPHLEMDRRRYTVTQRCAFKLNKKQ